MKHFYYAWMLCVFLLSIPASASSKVNKVTFKFHGKSRTYYSFVPTDEGPLPVVVLLHGSGRDGLVMANAWRSLAAKEHFIIAAPDAHVASSWQSDYDPPEFFHAVVEQVRESHAIDTSRIYLFGHSAGAVYSLLLALVDSEYYAATAVHAGALYPENYNLFAHVKRRMPLAIWVGDHDGLFGLDVVHATAKIFQSNGYQLELTVIPHHTHNYDEVSDEVDNQAWNFLKKMQLK